MSKEILPTTAVQVTRRQTLTPDVFGGMGNFYAPHDFYARSNVRSPKTRQRIARAVLKKLGKKPKQVKFAAAAARMQVQLYKSPDGPKIKSLLARKLAAAAKARMIEKLPPARKIVAMPGMKAPQIFRRAVPSAERDFSELPAGRQQYMVFSYDDPVSARNLFKNPRHAYNRVGTLQVPPGPQGQDYVDPMSITDTSDALDRTAIRVIPEVDVPAPIVSESQIPATMFQAMPDITGQVNSDMLVRRDEPLAEPLKTGTIRESTDYKLFQFIDKQLRPPQVIEHEELGWPYKLGESQRYAGMVMGPGASIPVDPSVIKGKPWQSPAFAWHNFSYDPLKNNPDPWAGMSGMGDIYSESEVRDQIDKAKAMQKQVLDLYASSKAKLVPLQIAGIERALGLIKNALGRAEGQYTAELEKPWYVDSDYDQAHKNALQAQTYAQKVLGDIPAFLRYNADERAKLADMEKTRKRTLELSEQVPPEELKAAQEGLISYTGYKTGQVVSKVTEEIAEAAGAARKALFGVIPWWVWPVGIAGVGLWFFGPALAGKALAGRTRA